MDRGPPQFGDRIVFSPMHSQRNHPCIDDQAHARPRSDLQPADAAALGESVGEDDESDHIYAQ